MNKLITISKSSPKFDSYLRGTFSKTERAKYVRTLNPNSVSEQITFELVPVAQIERPRGISFLGPLLRVRRLVLILFPFLFVNLNLRPDQKLNDPVLIVLGLLGLVFLFWAIYLRNDYSDHIQGLDRIYQGAGSQAIQKGWVTAQSVQIWSWIYLSAAIAFAIPILVVIPKLAVLVVATAGLLYLSHFRKNSFFKTQIWGAWLQGLLIGPLLFAGIELLAVNEVSVANLVAGIVWGFFVLFVIFLHDFETLVPSSQAGFHTWMSYLGFDRGRRFLEIWWAFSLVVYLGFQDWQRHWMIWMGSALILSYFSFRFLVHLRQLATPAGSQVVRIRQEGYQIFILAATLWSIQEILYSLFQSVFSLWSQSV